MKFLIYPFNLLFTILRKNIGKVITISVISLLFHISYNTDAYKDIQKQRDIIGETKIDGKYYYFYKNNDSSKDELMNISSDKPIKFKDNIYHYTESSDVFNICVSFAWLLLIILSTFLIIGWVDNNNSMHWELDECFEEAFKTFIICEFEDGKYYYIALGRLIETSSYQITNFSVESFRGLALCPKFKTKAQHRHDVLKKLVK